MNDFCFSVSGHTERYFQNAIPDWYFSNDAMHSFIGIKYHDANPKNNGLKIIVKGHGEYVLSNHNLLMYYNS